MPPRHAHPTRFRTLPLRGLPWFAAASPLLAALAPPAAADKSYYSQHLELTAVAGAPLRSGFVENIKPRDRRCTRTRSSCSTAPLRRRPTR
jgi:hypothetical protein